MNAQVLEKLKEAQKFESSIQNFSKLQAILSNCLVILQENQKWIPNLEVLDPNEEAPTYEELYQHIVNLSKLNEEKDVEIEKIKESAIQGILEKEEKILQLKNEISKRKSSDGNKYSDINDITQENFELRERFQTIAQAWEQEKHEYELKIAHVLNSQDEIVNEKLHIELQHQKLQVEKVWNDLRVSEDMRMDLEKERSKLLERIEKQNKEIQDSQSKIEDLSNAQDQLIALHHLEKESYVSTISNLKNASEEAISIYKLEKEALIRNLDGANEEIDKIEKELNECKARENKILERLDFTEKALQTLSSESDSSLKLFKEKMEIQRIEFEAEKLDFEKKLSELTDELLDIQTGSKTRKETFNKLMKIDPFSHNLEENLRESIQKCQLLKSKNKLLKIQLKDFERSKTLSQKVSSPFNSNHSTDEREEIDVKFDKDFFEIHIKSVLSSVNKLNSLSTLEELMTILEIISKFCLPDNKNLEFAIESISKIKTNLKCHSIFEDINKFSISLSELRRVFHQMQRNQLLTNNCITLLMTKAKQLKARNLFLKVSLKGFKKSASSLTIENSEQKKKIESLLLKVEELSSNNQELQIDKNLEKNTVLSPSHSSDSYFVEALKKELIEAQETIKKTTDSSRRRILDLAKAKEECSNLTIQINNLHKLLKEREELIIDKEKQNIDLINTLKGLKEELSLLKSNVDTNHSQASKTSSQGISNKLRKKKEKIVKLREQINILEFYLANEKRKSIQSEPKDLPRKTLVNSLDRLKQELRDMIEHNRNKLLEALEGYKLEQKPIKGELDLKSKIRLLIEDQSFLQFSHINFKIDFMLEKSDIETELHRAIEEAKEAKLKLAEMFFDKDRILLIFKKLQKLIRENDLELDTSLETEILSYA